MYTKTCKLCGDEFVAKQRTQMYCGKKHYKECPICKKDFLLKRNRETKTCSASCASEYRLKKFTYRLSCNLCGKEFESNVKHTKICSNKHYSECIICKKKFEIKDVHRPSSTCSDSCASSLSHTENAKKTRKINSLKKYGTEFPFQAQEIVKKIKRSLDSSENDMRIGSKKWNDMLKNKYGVTNISQVESIKKMKEQTYYEKYGVYNPAAMQINNYKDWNDFKEFVKTLNNDCLELAKYFNTSVGTIRQKAYQTDSVSYIKDFYKYSDPELEVKHLLTNMGLKEGIDFVPHNRKVINPLELDFYLPELKVAIEVSPTYTHNSKSGWGGEGEGLPKNYHYNKLRMCNDKGVELITLFEWIDINEVEVAINSKKRNCQKEADYSYHETFDLTKETKDFLKLNHNTFKGKNYRTVVVKSNKKIIAVLVWLEDRKRKKAILKHYRYSFDVNKNTLINFVILNYKETLKTVGIRELSIVSDSSIEFEETYINAGFQVIEEIEPRLNYHNIKKKMQIKSNKFINNNIDKLENNGFLPVYDCGHKKWGLIL